jgi:F420H(2)-dependent quinone reductase
VNAVPVEGEYEPSPAQWVREQVELYESSGGTQGTTLRDTGLPVVIVTTRGAKSGKIRKVPLMRVEHEGRYAAVASKGGFPRHPVWYFNLKSDPHVQVQDGPVRQDMTAREITGDEKAEWWERAVAAFPPYAEYQEKTGRVIPVFVLEPAPVAGPADAPPS